jgi:autotransporter-associated beta strand protein
VYALNIAGSGSVVVNAGSQAIVLLSGSSSYSGGTKVNAGTLRVGNSYAVGTGALQVNSAGILDVNGQSLRAGSLDLKNGSTTFMDISGTGTGLYAQVIGATTVAFGGALNIDFKQGGFAIDDFWQLFGGASYSGHFTSIAATGAYGSLTFGYLGDGEWKATGGNLGVGQSLSFYENDSHAFKGLFKAGQLVLVPEPSTLAIAGIGIFIAGWRACKRRRDLRRRSLATDCPATVAA